MLACGMLGRGLGQEAGVQTARGSTPTTRSCVLSVSFDFKPGSSLLFHWGQDPPDVNSVLIFTKCYFGTGVNQNL